MTPLRSTRPSSGEDPRDPQAQRDPQDPVLIGAALHPVEDRLRAELAAEAQTISPRHRLDAILAAAGEADVADRRRRSRRWLAPVAAAASVAAIAVGVWAADRPQDGPPPVAAPTSVVTPPPATAPSSPAPPTSVPTASATTSPAATASGSGAPAASQSPAPPPAPGQVQLPVYFVGPLAAGGTRLGLFREFAPATVAPDDKALAAVRRAMAPLPGSTYRELWRGRQALAVSASTTAITVRLTGPAATADAAEGRFAVQQLVWTATAAVGRGNLPVTFVVDGSTVVATGQPTSRAYTRPATPMDVATLLAPLWIDTPGRGERLAAGKPFTVSGQASTFEANVQWEVLRGATSVAKGFTTATAAGPARGGYRFSAPALPAGDYVVRVLEASMADGSVFAEQRVPVVLQ